MKRRIVSLLLFGVASTGLAQVTPIFVDLRDDLDKPVEINRQAMTLAQMQAWLADVAGEFGTQDPVIIRLRSNDDIAKAAGLSQIALRSHEIVMIGLHQPTSPGRNGMVFLPVREPWPEFAQHFPLPHVHSRRELQPPVARYPRIQPGESFQDALSRELSEATDVAIIKREESRLYRIESVVRGNGFLADELMHFYWELPEDLRDHPRLLIWEQVVLGDFPSRMMPPTHLRAVPVSEEDEILRPFQVPLSLEEVLPTR